MAKNISWRKLVRKFRALGFDDPYSGGKHLFMVRGDISRHLVSEILRQAGISNEDWNKA